MLLFPGLMFLLFLVKMFATHLKRPKRRVERRTDRTNGHRQVEDDNAYDGDDVVGDNNDDERGAWKEEQIRPMGIARSEMILIMMMMCLPMMN